MRAHYLCLVAAAVVSCESRRTCSYSPETETLDCQLRGFSKHNSSDFSGSATHAVVLRLHCTQDGGQRAQTIRQSQFGRLPGLRRLQINDCDIKTIQAYAFAGLVGLEELIISSSLDVSDSILELHKHGLHGLDNLKKIQISGMNIWTLPGSLFCPLQRLSSLNLSNNYLQEVSDLIASADSLASTSCLTHLHTLDISNNRLVHLPSNAFSQLSNLEILNVSNNRISRLEDKSLSGLDSLTSLSLAGNRLSAIPPLLLANTRIIRELYLESNGLVDLSVGIFSQLNKLLVLNVSRNSLSSAWLQKETFAGLVRLVALDLSHNRLDSLEGINLTNLTSLQIINLSNNRLNAIPAGSLSLPNLHILLLSSNSLKSISGRSLDQLPVLSTLSLNNNKLKKIPEGLFSNSSSIQDLNLSKNLLHSFPEQVSVLPSLRTLDVGGNRIRDLTPNKPWSIPSLYGLRLAENALTTLSQDFFSRVPEVEVLNLGSNNINTIQQDAFIDLGKLSALRLDQNQIPDINGLLTAQSKLRYLNVSSNQLHWFDYAFIPKNLEWLDIHGNSVEEIGNYYKLREGFKLHTLDASNNQIRKINQDSFLSGLRRIYINNNLVDTIQANSFIHIQNISLLDLSFNNIQTIHLSALTLHTLKRGSPALYLGFNPIVCDCETDFIPKLAELSVTGPYPAIADLDKITCTLGSFNGSGGTYEQPLVNTSPSQFLCNYQAHCFPLCLCCDYFACDCRMQCPDGCSCFHDSTWTHNMMECSSRNHTDIPPLIPMDATTVYLDGNRFGVLESQAFIGRKRVSTIYLNNSQITEISNRTLNGLVSLEILHLENNDITEITGTQFNNLTSLRELYLQNNKISNLHHNIFDNLAVLQVLFLGDNLLTTFPVLMLTRLTSLTLMSLSNNSWSCECNTVRELQELTRLLVVKDASKLECVEFNFLGQEETRVNIGNNISCINSLAVSSTPSTASFSSLPIVLGAILTLAILLAAVLLFVFRAKLRGLMVSRYKSGEPLRYVNLSYAPANEDFVKHVFAPNLKSCDVGYSAGVPLYSTPQNSRTSPNNSRSVLLVSQEYLETEWSGVRGAISTSAPIIVLLEDISSLQLAQVPEFGLLVRSCPVIRWSEPGFWTNFLYYLTMEGGIVPPKCVPGGYDCVGPNSDTSTSTRSTVEGSGSPRNMEVFRPTNPTTNTRKVGARLEGEVGAGVLSPHGRGAGMMNPLEHWSDVSDSGYGATRDHLYQTVNQDHIYHTLEPGTLSTRDHLGTGDLGTLSTRDHLGTGDLGNLEVMLPNGNMVPATLVRNADGRIFPYVHVPDDHLVDDHLVEDPTVIRNTRNNRTLGHRPNMADNSNHGKHGTITQYRV